MVSDLSRASDLILFLASGVYFWTLMFDHRPRVSGILAGCLFLGLGGALFRPEAADTFHAIATSSVAAILLRRVWLIVSKGRE